MTRIKKFISSLLVLAIVFGMVSMMAYAVNIVDPAGTLTVSVNIDTGRDNKKVIPGVSTVDAQISLKTEFHDGATAGYSGSGEIVFTYEKDFFAPNFDGDGEFITINEENEIAEEHSISAYAYDISDATTGRIIVDIFADQTAFNYDDTEWLFSIPMKVLSTAKKGNTDADGEGTISFDEASIILNSATPGCQTDIPYVAEDGVSMVSMANWRDKVTVKSTPDTVTTNNTVTFIHNDGTETETPVDGTVGTTYNAPEVSYIGYKLIEWVNVEEDGDDPVYNSESGKYEFVMPTDDDVKYIANWDPKLVTVTYNVVIDESTTIQVNSVDYEYGESIYIGPEYGATTTQEVAYWCIDKSCTKPLAANTPAEDDLDLYGKLVNKTDKHSAVFYYKDENQIDTSTTLEFATGQTIVAPVITEEYDDGVTFISWSPDLGIMGTENLEFTATYSEQKVSNVSYYCNSTDTEPYEVFDVVMGEEIDVPQNPEKEGYTFVEWQDENGNSIDTYTSMPGTDLKFYAVWDPNVCNVSYIIVSESGLRCVAEIPYEYGDEVYLGSKYGETATKEVKQWYEDIACTEKPVNAPYLATKDNILYGKLEDKTGKHKATFKYMDESKVWQTTEPVEYEIGEEIKAPTVTTSYDDGTEFKGWSPAVAVMGDKDINFVATYTSDETFKVSFYLDEDCKELHTEIDVAVGQEIDLPEDPEKPGYTFVEWQTENGQSPEDIGTMPTTDLTFHAVWDEKIVNVIYTIVDDEGNIVKVSNVVPYQYGDEIYLGSRYAETPTQRVAQWYKDQECTELAAAPLIAEDDITLFGKLTDKSESYKATFKYLDAEGKETESTAFISAGEEVTEPQGMTKSFSDGTAFLAWSPDLGTMPAEDVVFTATYTKENVYKVTYYTSEDDTETYRTIYVVAGNEIDVPEDPEKLGYLFTGWADSEGKTPEEIGTMPNSDISFHAGFDKVQITVHYIIVDKETGTQTPYSDIFEYGNPITLDNTMGTSVGEEIKGWYSSYDSNSKTFSDPVTSLTAGMDDITVYGDKQIKTHKATFKYRDTTGAIKTLEKDLKVGDAITVPDEIEHYEGFIEWTPAVEGVMPDNDVSFQARYDCDEPHNVYYYLSKDAYEADTERNNAWAVRDEIEVGGEIEIPDDPDGDDVPTGYSFKEWKTADGKTPDELGSMPAEDICFIADFEKNTYYAYYFNSEKELKPENADTKIDILYDEEIDTPEDLSGDAVPEGYSFKGWKTTDGRTPEQVGNMPAEDVYFIADFEKNTYKAYYFNSEKELKPENADTTIDVLYGDEIDTPKDLTGDAVPEGYSFKGWKTSDGRTPGQIGTMPAGDLYFTAVFEQNSSGNIVKLVPKDSSSTAMIERTIITSGSKSKIVETYNAKDTKKCNGVNSLVDVDESVYGDYSTDNNYDDWFIYGLETNKTVADLAKYVKVTGNGTYKVYGLNGNELGSTGSLGTGCVVKVFDGDKVVEQFYIIIFGDIDALANITETDLTTLGFEIDAENKAWSEGSKKVAYKVRAMDIDQTGTITETDRTLFGNVINNEDKYGINQITGLYTTKE